jgi:sensor c-di-GMP phosphodiesterase-like protein
MKLSNLKQADKYKLREYLRVNLNLNEWQQQRLGYDYMNFPDGSPYYIFVHEKPEKAGFLWRLTLVFLIPYIILISLIALLKWLFIGNRYFNHEGWFLKAHRYWMRKLGINWM